MATKKKPIPAKKTAKPKPKAKPAPKPPVKQVNNRSKPKPTPRPHGRPSLFSDKLADEICFRLSNGEPIAHICRDPHMPGVQTISDWEDRNPAFSVTIVRARANGGHYIAYRCRETARGRGDSVGDYLRDKLIIETDLRLLAKWFPHEYGDRLTVDQTVKTEKPSREDFIADLVKSKAFREEFRGMLDEADRILAEQKKAAKP